MKVECPKCRKPIDPAHLNAATDVAVCPGCGDAFVLSELVPGTAGPTVDLRSPPAGAWYRTMPDGWEVGATTRSWAAAYLVPFMCVWSGGSLGGIYGSQIAKGQFDLTQSLFGIPFILGSILFWWLALMAIWGKVTVDSRRGEGRVFVGLARIGRSRRFDWNDVTVIRENATNYNYPGGNNQTIVLEGKQRISFGTGLNEARRFFVLQAIRQLRAGR